MKVIDDNEINKISVRIHKLTTSWQPAIGAKFRAAGEYILTEARKLVPFDTGALWESGQVRLISIASDLSVEVSFNTPYALYVHEDLTKRHGRAFNEYYAEDIAAGRTHARRPEEQAKFLEDVMKKHYYQIRIMLT